MGKFLDNLRKNNKGIRDERAIRLDKRVENAQVSLVRAKQDRVFQLEDKIESLLDLSPTHSTSLDFKESADADRYVNELHDLQVELRLAKVELEIAEETQEKLFGKEKINESEQTDDIPS